MTQPSANEQYMLELINAERAKVGAQALAFDANLLTSSENHSQWMLASDTFSHTGSGGSDPTQRMTAAGYNFAGSWASAENIAWATTRAPAEYQDEVQLLHTNLMNSPGHRTNLLNANFKEIGIGFEIGDYQGRESAFVTENFAKSGTGSLLTGVTFNDKDGDKFYDPGEALSQIAIKAVSSSGATYATSTMDAGGYQLDLPNGTYTVTFSGAGIAETSRQVTIGATNIKLDLVNPATTGGTLPAPQPTPLPQTPIPGTSGNDKLYGTPDADVIQGLAGNDILSGGQGQDVFVFNTKLSARFNVDRITDFSVKDDTIWLDHAIFTKIGNGTPTAPLQLAAGAFWAGKAAHDANDRIIYDPSTGALSYDADGNGSSAQIKFAQLATGLKMTATDLFVV
jgi:hypothetical protein